MKKLQDHWKDQEMTTISPTLDDLRQREAELGMITRRRNIREYVAGGAAAAFLAVMGVLTFVRGGAPADLVMATGLLALTAGLLLAGWHLFRSSGPAGDLAVSGRAHLRARLEREHRLLASAWLWYVGPMVPGLALIYLGAWMIDPGKPLFVAIASGLTLALMVGVALANRHAARKIEREIRNLDE
ncbi:MAG: hypothetical protein LCH86_08365 [Proteobacteria bacterium]|nr:hypothetical protein [Pseudomonadota bacterium]